MLLSLPVIFSFPHNWILSWRVKRNISRHFPPAGDTQTEFENFPSSSSRHTVWNVSKCERCVCECLLNMTLKGDWLVSLKYNRLMVAGPHCSHYTPTITSMETERFHHNITTNSPTRAERERCLSFQFMNLSLSKAPSRGTESVVVWWCQSSSVRSWLCLFLYLALPLYLGILF